MQKIPTLFIRQFENHKIEGIVFWYGGKPLCKIKRSDFGFKWPTL